MDIQGKVGSFFGLGLNEYTAFTAVNDTIQDIVALEEAVVVVSKNTIFGYKRQGLPLFEYRCVELIKCEKCENNSENKNLDP